LLEQVFGHTMGELCDCWAQTYDVFTLRLEREARDLMHLLR
jgi:hypothetical protein